MIIAFEGFNAPDVAPEVQKQVGRLIKAAETKGHILGLPGFVEVVFVWAESIPPYHISNVITKYFGDRGTGLIVILFAEEMPNRRMRAYFTSTERRVHDVIPLNEAIRRWERILEELADLCEPTDD